MLRPTLPKHPQTQGGQDPGLQQPGSAVANCPRILILPQCHHHTFWVGLDAHHTEYTATAQKARGSGFLQQPWPQTQLDDGSSDGMHLQTASESLATDLAQWRGLRICNSSVPPRHCTRAARSEPATSRIHENGSTRDMQAALNSLSGSPGFLRATSALRSAM